MCGATWELGALTRSRTTLPATGVSGSKKYRTSSWCATTLQGVVDTRDYLESDPACEALAAAEVIARLKGHWGVRDASTEAVDEWVEAHPGTPPAGLVTLAVAAIDRVLTEPSELLELWSDSADLDKWKAALTDLRARVSA